MIDGKASEYSRIAPRGHLQALAGVWVSNPVAAHVHDSGASAALSALRIKLAPGGPSPVRARKWYKNRISCYSPYLCKEEFRREVAGTETDNARPALTQVR